MYKLLNRFFDSLRVLFSGESRAMSLELLHCHNKSDPYSELHTKLT